MTVSGKRPGKGGPDTVRNVFYRSSGVHWTALSGGGFDRCLVNKSHLVLFPGVWLAGRGRLIFRGRVVLSLNWSERAVQEPPMGG